MTPYGCIEQCAETARLLKVSRAKLAYTQDCLAQLEQAHAALQQTCVQLQRERDMARTEIQQLHEHEALLKAESERLHGGIVMTGKAVSTLRADVQRLTDERTALQQTCNGMTNSRDHWHRQYTSLLRHVKDTEQERDDARTETQLICDDYRQLQLDLQHRTDERDAWQLQAERAQGEAERLRTRES